MSMMLRARHTATPVRRADIVAAMATRVHLSGADGGLGARVRAAARRSAASRSSTRWTSADVVVHVGSGDHDARARRRESVTTGVASMLADARRRTDVDQVVFVSSAIVYGAYPNNPIPLTEDAVLRPDVDFVFARQLATAEALVDEWRRAQPGRAAAVLRPVVAMAADGSSSLARALAAGFGQRFGEDDPPAQFLHLDDLASAVSVAVDDRLDGVFNVAPDGWIAGERVRALTGSNLRLKLARAGLRGARRAPLAVPAGTDPTRHALLHEGALARRQRPAQGPRLATDRHQRAGLRRGHRGEVVDDDHAEAPPGAVARRDGRRHGGAWPPSRSLCLRRWCPRPSPPPGRRRFRLGGGGRRRLGGSRRGGRRFRRRGVGRLVVVVGGSVVVVGGSVVVVERGGSVVVVECGGRWSSTVAVR